MRNITNYRKLWLSLCLLIGLVTLLSHNLQVEIKSNKSATEQSAETSQKTVIISSSDAVTVNFFTLNVDGFLEIAPIFQPVRKVQKVVPVFQRVATSFHQTLFRFIISPNAP